MVNYRNNNCRDRQAKCFMMKIEEIRYQIKASMKEACIYIHVMNIRSIPLLGGQMYLYKDLSYLPPPP